MDFPLKTVLRDSFFLRIGNEVKAINRKRELRAKDA